MLFFFNDTATTEIYTLSLHDALPIYRRGEAVHEVLVPDGADLPGTEHRSEEHTSELQSQFHLVCRLLLEKKKKTRKCRQAPPQPRRQQRGPRMARPARA